MLDVMLFMIISFWMSNIIVEQKVFQELRDIVVSLYDRNPQSLPFKKLCQLISCVVCVGFWCGGFIAFTGFDVFNKHPQWDLLYGALLGSFGSYIGLVITTLIRVHLKLKFDIRL
jgi:hypothetical protein